VFLVKDLPSLCFSSFSQLCWHLGKGINDMRWLMLYLDVEQTHGTWYIGLICQSISTHNSKTDVHAISDEVSPLNSVRWSLGLEICPGYSDIQKG
jgi:hypothetical protein